MLKSFIYFDISILEQYPGNSILFVNFNYFWHSNKELIFNVALDALSHFLAIFLSNFTNF